MDDRTDRDKSACGDARERSALDALVAATLKEMGPLAPDELPSRLRARLRARVAGDDDLDAAIDRALAAQRPRERR